MIGIALTTPVSIYKTLGNTSLGGQSVWDEPVTCMGYFEPMNKLITKSTGDVIQAVGMLILNSTANVDVEDKIGIDGENYLVISVERFGLMGSGHHIEVVLQNTIQ